VVGQQFKNLHKLRTKPQIWVVGILIKGIFGREFQFYQNKNKNIQN